MPEATQWSGVARPVQSPTAIEIRTIRLRDGEQLVAVEHAQPGRLMGEPGQALELREGQPAQIERALRSLGQADDDQPEPVLARLVVLLHQTALLERREQARRGRLVEAEPAGELGDASGPRRVSERKQERRRSIDRTDGVALERHGVPQLAVVDEVPL